MLSVLIIRDIQQHIKRGEKKMKLRRIMLPVLGLSLALLVSANIAFGQTATDYYNLAEKAIKEYSYNDAITYYNLAGNLWKEEGRKDYYAIMMNKIGLVYNSRDQYDKAIEHFRKALAIDEELGNKGSIAIRLNNIGMMYKSWGQYDKAIEHFRKALAINEELGKKGGIATGLNNIGLVYYSRGQYDKAIENYRKALIIKEELGQKDEIAIQLNNIGAVYKAWGQYDKAIEHFRKVLAIDEENGKKGSIATDLNNIGVVYNAWGQYDKAIEHFRKALAINEELGKKGGIARDLNNIGMVYNDWGQYDKAIEHYLKALAINEELSKKDQIAIQLNNIGLVYRDWGQYDKAIEHFRKSLAIDEELGKKGSIATDLNNIGLVYYSREQYDKAIEYFRKALAIAEELGQKDKIANRLNCIGGVYKSWCQYDKAIEYFRKALAIVEELGKKDQIATQLNNIGVVYNAWGQYDKAIEHYLKALAINEELGQKGQVASRFHNIGAAYCSLKIYKKAEENFNKSIAIIEELRLTAKGAIRRDYLASQIGTYQYLTATYIRDKKYDLAFNTIELSSAKYLIEQMGERLDEKDFRFEGIDSYMKKINDNNVIICYSNINTIMGTAQIVVDKDNILAIEVEKENLTSNINLKYKNVILTTVEDLRGMKKVKDKEEEVIDIGDEADFDEVINYYRLLLTKPNLTSKEEETVQYMGKELYKFLFGSIENQLEGKDELIIIPDGVLSFLPFETLIMPDGRYLIEKYHLKYTQSLTVSEIIDRRSYSQNRKPLLAFGGAVYDEISYETDIIKAEKQLENLINETLLALNRGQSTRNAYNRLGLAEWGNLPGTLAEVNSIKHLIKGSDIYTGESVNESKVKSLSKEGDLKEYKVLHFATHGLVVPEIPELSAIVLSLLKDEKNNEDGYLTMKEIAGLDINADFVNLSACETGLGKIYSGEGVVGLTQSFLIAGANGISVSLWQVADESTMKFMIGVYKLVEEQGLSYDEAITEMKRAFISGAVSTEKYDKNRGLIIKEVDLNNKKPNDYSSPFYWAPFVYYGK